MKVRKLIAGLAAGFLAGVLITGAMAQEAPVGKTAVSKAARTGRKITLQAKVKHLDVMGGYYLRGRSEIYKIANQNPEILEPLAKSGESVTIEAFARGDLLTIQTLNGKKYQKKGQPAK
jgi:hypothetical protein